MICNLETLPAGHVGECGCVWRTTSTKYGDLYSINKNERIKGAFLRLFLRVDDGNELPIGVEEAYFRQDGCRVIKAWDPEDTSLRGEWAAA